MPVLAYYEEKIPADAPPSVRARMMEEAKRKSTEDVFGVGFQRDRNGKPIEQGKGSAAQPTQQSIDAYVLEQTTRRVGGPEPGYEQHLARMRKDLATYQARKAVDHDDE
jgi:hypothetical protein